MVRTNDDISYATLIHNDATYDAMSLGGMDVNFLIPQNNVVLQNFDTIHINISTRNQGDISEALLNFSFDISMTNKIQIIDQINCYATAGTDYVRVTPISHNDPNMQIRIIVAETTIDITINNMN